MPRRKTILIVAIVLCLLGGAVGVVGVPVYQRIRAFSVEDSIHGTFFPVTAALYRYQDEHGSPADSLSALVPEYLNAIPSSILADPPHYKVSPDTKSWELLIYSRALAQPRNYICRSTQVFTPEERRRLLIQYHSVWAVFASAD